MSSYKIKNQEIAVEAIKKQANIIHEQTHLDIEALNKRYVDKIGSALEINVASVPIVMQKDSIQFIFYRDKEKKYSNSIRLERYEDWMNEDKAYYKLSGFDSTIKLDDQFDLDQYSLVNDVFTGHQALIKWHTQYNREYVELYKNSKEINIALDSAEKSLEEAIVEHKKNEIENLMKAIGDKITLKDSVGVKEITDDHYNLLDAVIEQTKKYMEVSYGRSRWDTARYVVAYRINEIAKKTINITLFVESYSSDTITEQVLNIKPQYVEDIVRTFYNWNTVGAIQKNNDSIKRQAELLKRIESRKEKI